MAPGADKSPQYQPSQAAHVASMLNGDSTLFAQGARKRKLIISDLYHSLLLLSWPKFILFFITSYFSINLIFAVIYFFCGPDSLDGVSRINDLARFSDCFFFSVQTLATIGYGHISPLNFWANFFVTLQALLGILFVAIVTGVCYGRFSKPTARVIFSKHILMSSYNGKPCLILRLANERLNQIVEAKITVSMTQNEISKEGEMTRRFHGLKLERDFSALFSLSWIVRHFIEEDSPLFGYDHEKMKEKQVVILASMTGIDGTFSQAISARRAYSYEDIQYNKRFKDMIFWNDSKVNIKLEYIHDTIDLKDG